MVNYISYFSNDILPIITDAIIIINMATEQERKGGWGYHNSNYITGGDHLHIKFFWCVIGCKMLFYPRFNIFRFQWDPSTCWWAEVLTAHLFWSDSVLIWVPLVSTEHLNCMQTIHIYGTSCSHKHLSYPPPVYIFLMLHLAHHDQCTLKPFWCSFAHLV